MKRSKLSQTGVTTYGVRKSLSPVQLECIGAIAMAYNEAEASLDDAMSACIQFRANTNEIISRINGAEGKIAIIKAAAAEFALPNETNVALTESLGAFSMVKTFRDAVVHSRVHDIQTSIGRTRAKKGAMAEVLLSPKALEWLFSQIELIDDELDSLSTALNCAHRLLRSPEPDAQHKARLEQSVRDATALCRGHQLRRRKLRQPPKFPDESEIQALRSQPITIRLDDRDIL